MIHVITAARVQQLKDLGYYIEEMGVEYGPDFEGQFRWLNHKTQDFQDWGASDSVNEAWADADRHANEPQE